MVLSLAYSIDFLCVELQTDVTCRLMAVRYAISVFPTDHVASRFVLLLACGDQ